MCRRILVSLCLCVVAGCTNPVAPEPADLILTGGEIYSADGWAQAIAVRDDIIVAVGDAGTIARLKGSSTRVIQLAGATVFPGLQDSHTHPFIAVRERFQPCRIPPEPLPAILATVADCVGTTAKGEWITSGPFAQALVESGLDRRALDGVAPDHPVALTAAGSHAVVLNSLALKAAGINRATVAPPGGEILRDADGEPTGVLLDAWSLLPPSPPPPPDMVARAGTWALNKLMEVGVTSLTDANAGPIEQRAYADLAAAEQLKQRVRVCRNWSPATTTAEVSLEVSVTPPNLTSDCVKIFVDGESGTGRTGALLEPYIAANGSATLERGELAVPPDVLNAAVTRFDRAGLTVKLHAWGDAAVAAAVTAIEAARTANGPSGPRHQIAHAALARREDLVRAREANAVIEISPWLWFPPAGEYMFRSIGPERMARAWPVRDALEVGVSVVGGTDWATAPGRSPWAAIETLVTRLEPASIEAPVYRFGPPSPADSAPFAPGQRIRLEDAIALFTSMPAKASGRADAPGILATGRKADMIVLDRNPLKIPITEVHATAPTMVIVGGEVVYDASSPSSAL